MVKKNIQMKHFNGVDWDELSPITSPDNVINKVGRKLQDIIDNIGVTVDAVGNGIADDTQAFKDAIAELKRIGGTRLYINSGIYMISEPLVFDFDGINIIGTPYRTQFKPSATFSGSELFKFVRGNGSLNVSGLSIEGVFINMGNKLGHGITVVNGYQFIYMLNVEIIEVNGKYSAFNFTYESGNNIAGQTVLMENTHGEHALGLVTRASYFMERYFEVVFIGAKGIASHHASGDNISGTAFHFLDCRGITMYGCSVAFAQIGILFEGIQRSPFGLTVSGLTSEKVMDKVLHAKTATGLNSSYINFQPMRAQSEGGDIYLEDASNSLIYGLTSKVTITGSGSRNIVYSSGEDGVTAPSGNMIWKVPDYYYPMVGLENNLQVITESNPYLSAKIKGTDKELRLRYLATVGTETGFAIEQKINGVWREKFRMADGGATFFNDSGRQIGRFFENASNGYSNLTVAIGTENDLKRIRYGSMNSAGTGYRALYVEN